MIEISKNKYCIAAIVLSAIFAAGCQPAAESTKVNINAQTAETGSRPDLNPTISAAPVTDGDGGYKLISGEDFKLTVRATGASAVELFYQPVTADDRAILLKTLDAASDGDSFVADLKIPEDFNGEVWGRAKYQNGESKETEHVLLARRADADPSSEAKTSGPPAIPESGSQGSEPDTDESARSDSLTGGRIQHAALKGGDGDIRITVNVPAFRLTMWQGDKEIKSTYVGVGRKNYPIPIGMRSAEKIILNPDWIPPNSEWVRKSSKIEPYERIPADDPDNPLGKVKIPLGQAYLLHEAQSASDIGNLVSHGCVRVMRDDLFDLTSMIVKARNLSVSPAEIAAAKHNTDRRVIDLNGDIPVDINYDTMVVENGILTIYPDVYERSVNTVANLREELQKYGVDASAIDDATLNEMIGKVNGDEKFVVPIADVKNGNALKGKVEPLTPQQDKKSSEKAKK